MALNQILLLLRARWRFALSAWVIVVVLAAAFSFLRTPQYTATASIVLDVKSPDPFAGVVLPGLTAVSYMATQLNVLQSERVAVRAIRALHLDTDPVLLQQWRDKTDGKGDFPSWLSDGMLRKLDAVPARDANVIVVSYTASDPAFAAAVANAWVTSYIDTTLELRVEPAKKFNSFFDARGKQLREDLEKAQARLSAYQQSNGIVASDERLDIENLRLAELSSQLVALQGLASDSGSRQSESANNADRMQEVLNNPLLVSLGSELARQEGRLQELSARLGDKHPSVGELRSSVDDLRARMASETRRVTGSLAANNNINQARVAQLRASVDEQRSKLLRLKGQRDEATVLQRDVENARRAYDAVLGRASETGVESQANQTNVSVLKQATTPVEPSAPRVVLNLAIAAFIGILLAVGGALLRESKDRRMRTDLDVLQGLRQPLLGVMPSKRAKAAGASRLRLTPRLASALPPSLTK